MWVKKPSRVPGRSQTVLTLTRISRTEVDGGGAALPFGVFLTRASVRAIDTTPSATTDRYAAVQPRPASSARNGTAESTCPSWPQMPVSWVTNGTWSGLNQCGTSLSTEMNVTASPSPTTARAAIAAGSDSVNASVSWPAAITVAPDRISALEPKRSSSRPAGTCAPAYTTICRTTNADSTPGPAVNRSPASMPETPSVVRSSTATM